MEQRHDPENLYRGACEAQLGKIAAWFNNGKELLQEAVVYRHVPGETLTAQKCYG